MKVFMLGWEFPPMVSGGLGVACYGLAKALNSQGVNIMFVLPKPRLRPAAVHAGEAASKNNGTKAAPRQTHDEIRRIHAASADDVRDAVNLAVQHATGGEAIDRASPSPHTVAAMADAARLAARPFPDEILTAADAVQIDEEQADAESELQQVTFVPVDAFLAPYLTPAQYQHMMREAGRKGHGSEESHRWVERAVSAGAEGSVPQPPNHPALLSFPAAIVPPPPPLAAKPQRTYIHEPSREETLMGAGQGSYSGDLFAETRRYARLALAVARDETFSIVHAHDWMTFDAAMAVAAASGKPLVVQIHSTELDRAGASANGRIMEIERQGLVAAARVIAVSYKTKTQLIEKYGIDPRKIEVVYNGADAASGSAPAGHGGETRKPNVPHKRTVLFLGRLTQQKGPAYFLHAAKKVLSVEPEVEFVLGGRGEMRAELEALAAELGISHHVVFAGFLSRGKKAYAAGRKVATPGNGDTALSGNQERAERILASADVFVMPSVSEPFGIAPLEALARDVPVIISKQSGVAEVLRHVLKVDFWDTDDLANKILALLRHPPLAATLREHGQKEVRQLTWDDSARRIVELYERLAPQEALAAGALTAGGE